MVDRMVNLDSRKAFRPSYMRELEEHGHIRLSRGLDGDAILNAISQGISSDDVANGSVDPSQLTRAQQASLAIDGLVPSASEATIKWSPCDVDEQSLFKLFGQGGGVITFRQNNSVFTAGIIDVIDDIAPPRAALLWDDNVVAVSAFKLDISVLHGAQSLIIESGPIRGNRLTLWVESALLSFNVVAISPTGTTQQALTAETEALSPISTALDKAENAVSGAASKVGGGVGDALTGFGNTFNSVIGKFFDVELAVGLALTVVAGIALFLWLEDKGPRHE